MTEKSLVKFDSLPEKNFGGGKITFDRDSSRKPEVLKKEQRTVVFDFDFDYIPSAEDERLIASLEAKIEEIKFNLANSSVIMTPGDKLREKERQESASKTAKHIQNIFSDEISKPKDVPTKETSRISRFFGEVKRIFTEPKRLRSLVGAGIAAFGIAHSASVWAESTGEVDTNTTIETDREMLSQKSDLGVDPTTSEVSPNPSTEILEVKPSPTPEYAIKEQKNNSYREFLKENGCQDINIDFCTPLLYGIDENDGFVDTRIFTQPEKTILSNYISREEVVLFGKTGKIDKNWNWDVIYFKDEKGKRTKEPAVAYVYNPEIKHFKISDIEKAIDWWEDKGVFGFLNAIVANDARIIFQSQAGDNNKVATMKYGEGIIYCNFSSSDLVKFQTMLIKGLAVEMFGVKGDALKNVFGPHEVTAIKSYLAVDCCKHMYKLTGFTKFNDLAKSFQISADGYMSRYGLRLEDINKLIKRIKSEMLMTPYGAKTWIEIDSVINSI